MMDSVLNSQYYVFERIMLKRVQLQRFWLEGLRRKDGVK